MITVTISTTLYIIAHRQAFHKKNLRRPRIFCRKGNTSPASARQKKYIVFLTHPILISPLHFNFIIFSKMSKLNLTNDKNDDILYDR